MDRPVRTVRRADLRTHGGADIRQRTKGGPADVGPGRGAIVPAAAPLVSVIVPTYNRERLLGKCLQALLRQTYPGQRYEVIVIDDGSTDGTDARVAAISRELSTQTASPTMIYRYQEHSGISAARNRGIGLASGELVVFVDSDIVVKRDFIDSHVRVHLSSLAEPDATLERDRTILHGRVIYTTNLDDPVSTRRKITDTSTAFFATTNTSIARKWLVDAGLFDEEFTEYGWEDLELGRRLRRLGLRVVRSDEPVGYHLKREFTVADLPAVKRREIERGHMAVLYYRKHPTFGVRMATMLVPPFFWLVALLALGSWPERPGAARLLDRIQRGGHRAAVSVMLQVMVYFWYARGMREALLRSGRFTPGR